MSQTEILLVFIFVAQIPQVVWMLVIMNCVADIRNNLPTKQGE